MDRNDAGIIRSIVVRLGSILARNVDPNGKIPINIVGGILETCARLHDVVLYSDITNFLVSNPSILTCLKYFSDKLTDITAPAQIAIPESGEKS
jgi:hypothetical protein